MPKENLNSKNHLSVDSKNPPSQSSICNIPQIDLSLSDLNFKQEGKIEGLKNKGLINIYELELTKIKSFNLKKQAEINMINENNQKTIGYKQLTQRVQGIRAKTHYNTECSPPLNLCSTIAPYSDPLMQNDQQTLYTRIRTLKDMIANIHTCMGQENNVTKQLLLTQLKNQQSIVD